MSYGAMHWLHQAIARGRKRACTKKPRRQSWLIAKEFFASDSSVARRHRENGRYFAGEIAAIPIQEWGFRGGDAECNRLSEKIVILRLRGALTPGVDFLNPLQNRSCKS